MWYNSHPQQSISCVLITVDAKDSLMRCYSRPTRYSNWYNFVRQKKLWLYSALPGFELCPPCCGEGQLRSFMFWKKKLLFQSLVSHSSRIPLSHHGRGENVGCEQCSVTLNKHTQPGELCLTLIHTMEMRSFKALQLSSLMCFKV